MKDTALVLPDRIDLVTIEKIETRLRREYDEVRKLGELSRDLRSTAAELERRAREERVDADTALWMYVRLREFLAEVREEAESEAVMVVEVARRDAEQIRLGTRTATPLPFSGARRSRVGAPEPAPAIRWAPAPGVPGPPTAVELVEPTALEPVDIDLPALEATEPPVSVEAEAAAPAEVVVPVTVSGMSLVDPLAPAGPVEITEADAEFWATIDAQPWWRRKRRHAASTAAVLQVTAGIVAAVAVAVHFV